MNITIDDKNKTLIINEPTPYDDLNVFVSRHSLYNYKIISKIEYYNQTQYPWISYTTPNLQQHDYNPPSTCCNDA